MNTPQPQLKGDCSSWPSRFYGRTRHLDLEQIYNDVLAKSMQQQDGEGKTNKRRVRISTEAPTIYEYEPEYDADDVNRPSPSYMPIDPSLVALILLGDEEGDIINAVTYRSSGVPAARARSLKRLDLQPIRNPNYQRKTTRPSVTIDDDSGSVSSAEPETPEDPFPEQSWPTSKPIVPRPALRKMDVVRLSINRIRSTPWIAKKAIQKIL